MRVQVNVHLSQLQCIVPNESSDEPYLWTYFLKLDGETIHQHPNGNTLLPSVVVHSAPGSHGNLGASGVRRGRQIPVPAALGDFSTTLRPIEIAIPGGARPVPGQLLVVGVLLEEDDSPDDGIENGRASLRLYIEQRVNEFIADLSLLEIRAEATERVAAKGGDLMDHVGDIIRERLDTLTQEIRDNAETVITLEVLAAHTPGAIWEFLDADDKIGAVTLRFDERDLLTSPDGGNRFIFEQLLDEDNGHVKALYRLIGAVSTTVTGSNTDLQHVGESLDSTPVESGSHVFHVGVDQCIKVAGERADWTRFNQREEERFLLTAPFIGVDWSIDGERLTGSSGDVRVRDKTCAFPFFDPGQPEGPSYRSQVQEVVILFDRFVQDGLPGIRLRNRPEDGSYYATLQATGTVGVSTKVLLARDDFAFDGQSVQSDFYTRYRACEEAMRSLMDRYAKYKRVGPRDLWGPHERHRFYEEQIKIGEQLVHEGLLAPERLEVGLRVLRQQLRIA